MLPLNITHQRLNKVHNKVKKIFVLKLYATFQVLSLDVVLGINIFSLAISKYYGVPVSWHIIVGRSIAIWLIYTVDHLLDAQKIKKEASTYRHRFHQQYQKQLLIICVLFFIIGFINMFYLPAIVLISGLILGALTTFYLLMLQKTIFWAKEISVALIYTIGVFIGPLSLSYNHIYTMQWMLIPEVFFLAFANLLLFSWFDMFKDRRDGHASMSIHWGACLTQGVLKTIVALAILSCCVVIFFNYHSPTLIMQLIFIAMFLILAFIYKYNNFFKRNDMYRALGDAIFYLPAIYLLYAG